jgi:hypothetical protein
MALWSRAKAQHATRRVVTTAPVTILVGYVLMISLHALSIGNGRARPAPFRKNRDTGGNAASITVTRAREV